MAGWRLAAGRAAAATAKGAPMVKVVGLAALLHGVQTAVGGAVWPLLCFAPPGIVFTWAGIFEATRAASDALCTAPPAHETRCGLAGALAGSAAAAAVVGIRFHTGPPNATSQLEGAAGQLGRVLAHVRFHGGTFAGSAVVAAVCSSVVRGADRRKPQPIGRGGGEVPVRV
mmetsp:Transcript_15453/g.39203  ORF Transcript_15453/g.39203 Transcript_15453/m.39203 type:complete len:171 (-) Transcript_15453:346-858(-)